MFHRRFRTGWEAPDTVFDAWLMLRGWERPWFDRHRFDLMYPGTADDVVSLEQPSKKRAVLIDNLVDASDLLENDLTMLMPQVESTPKKNSTIILNESRSPDDTRTGGETDPETSGNSSDEYDSISSAEEERSEDDDYPLTQKNPKKVISSESETESDECKAIKFVVDTVCLPEE